MYGITRRNTQHITPISTLQSDTHSTHSGHDWDNEFTPSYQPPHHTQSNPSHYSSRLSSQPWPTRERYFASSSYIAHFSFSSA